MKISFQKLTVLENKEGKLYDKKKKVFNKVDKYILLIDSKIDNVLITYIYLSINIIEDKRVCAQR